MWGKIFFSQEKQKIEIRQQKRKQKLSVNYYYKISSFQFWDFFPEISQLSWKSLSKIVWFFNANKRSYKKSTFLKLSLLGGKIFFFFSFIFKWEKQNKNFLWIIIVFGYICLNFKGTNLFLNLTWNAKLTSSSSMEELKLSCLLTFKQNENFTWLVHTYMILWLWDEISWKI